MSSEPNGEVRITDNIEQLLQVLPPDIRAAIQSQPRDEELLEIVLDLGRQPEARYVSGSLYLLVFTGLRWLGAVTPIGGVAMIAAWLGLALVFLRSSRA